MSPAARMSCDDLEAVGLAIYGPQWVTPMARDLRDLTCRPLADRTMQRWAARTGAPPEALRADLLALLDAKIAAATARAEAMATVRAALACG